MTAMIDYYYDWATLFRGLGGQRQYYPLNIANIHLYVDTVPPSRQLYSFISSACNFLLQFFNVHSLHAIMSHLQAPPDCYSHVAAIRKACQLTCTIDTCSLSFSYWAYRPSVPANALFIALFSISLLCFLGQAIFSRRYIGFSIAMISGSALEVLGYGGRLWAYFNPFEEVSYNA